MGTLTTLSDQQEAMLSVEELGRRIYVEEIADCPRRENDPLHEAHHWHSRAMTGQATCCNCFKEYPEYRG